MGIHERPFLTEWLTSYLQINRTYLKEKAGVEKDLTYHCSRHTTASLAISAGADISAVKDVLGHGSITSTEVYAKVALEKKIEAVNLFNGVFD